MLPGMDNEVVWADTLEDKTETNQFTLLLIRIETIPIC